MLIRTFLLITILLYMLDQYIQFTREPFSRENCEAYLRTEDPHGY